MANFHGWIPDWGRCRSSSDRGISGNYETSTKWLGNLLSGSTGNTDGPRLSEIVLSLKNDQPDSESHVGAEFGLAGCRRKSSPTPTNIKSTGSLYGLLLPYTRPLLKQWQDSWNNETLNKLHAPKVNVINAYRLPRRDEIIIHRLRIGISHT